MLESDVRHPACFSQTHPRFGSYLQHSQFLVTQEKKLREAVMKLGTKDWSLIHEEMGTDRSIKQLQDHWNDTKNNRIPARV
jgi:hypothetical protein